MSMSTHVVAFRPPDEGWKKMKAVWDSCQAAGIALPEEVYDFFGGEPPDENGVEVSIDEILEEWSDEDRMGYQLELSRLPKGVSILRFYNAW